MNLVSEVIQQIVSVDRSRFTTLVAVDGEGGAGKTILASALAGALEAIGRCVEIVHFDDFFLPSALRPSGQGVEKPIGGDFDWQRLRDEVLIPLRGERTASYARYDWNEDALAEIRKILSGAIVIVEGIYSSRKELAPLYDLRVWVDCPRHLRLSRGIARDGEASRAQWELDWMPSEDRYLNEHRPYETADMVVSGAASLGQPRGRGST